MTKSRAASAASTREGEPTRGKRVIKRVCPDCWGSGYQVVDHRKSKCAKCHGTGQIEEEIEVRD